MHRTKHALKARRLAISTVVAISMVLVLTAAVSASSQTAVWSGIGQVVLIGASPDPANPTLTQSEFTLRRDGTVRSVKIKTSNEAFAAVLGGGPDGSAITRCRDRRGSSACENLDSILTGSQLLSVHNSKATLSRVKHGKVQVPTGPAPGSPTFTVPTLSGSLRGKLEGQFTLSNDLGAATGTASLRIGRGSTGTYACFGLLPSGQLAPLPSLQPCIDHDGALLFPIVLDVNDKGKFEIGPGSGSMSDILGLKGMVHVKAQANLLTQQFAGTVVISKSKASLVGEDGKPVGDSHGIDDDDDKKNDRR